MQAAHSRTVTGVLTSRPTSRDIKIDGFSMGLNGQELIQDCTIELTIGRRYGLIGANGSGKTNFLQCLAAREVRAPPSLIRMDAGKGCLFLRVVWIDLSLAHQSA